MAVVKKSSGKWRMCTNFTDINNACPKDSFLLPRIDMLVDSTSALIWEENGVQKLVYFTNRALWGVDERYTRIEKLAFAIVISARRLRPYFKAHTIWVLIEHLPRRTLYKLNTSVRLVNWAVEFSEFDIKYLPKTTTNLYIINWLAVINHFCLVLKSIIACSY